MGKQKNYLLLVLKGCAMGAADVFVRQSAI